MYWIRSILLFSLLAFSAPDWAVCAWYHKLNPKNLFKRATPKEKAEKERVKLLADVNSRIHKTNALFQEINQTKESITENLAQAEEDVEKVEGNLPQKDPVTKQMLKRSKKRMRHYAQRLEQMTKTRDALFSDLNAGEINNIYERLLSHQKTLQGNAPLDENDVRLTTQQIDNIRADIKKADQIRKATKKKIRTTVQRLKSWSQPWKKKTPEDTVQADKTLRLAVFARSAPEREKAANDLEERACQIEIIKVILQDAGPQETLSPPLKNLQANLSGIRSKQKYLKETQANFKAGTKDIADVENALTETKNALQNVDKGIASALKNSPILENETTTNDFKNFVTGYLDQKANKVSSITKKLYWAQDTLKRVKQTESIKRCVAKASQYGPHDTTQEESDLHDTIQKIRQWGAKKAYIAHIEAILRKANNVIDMCKACLKDTDALRFKERSEMARDNQMHDTQDNPQKHAHAALGTVVDPKENPAGQEMQKMPSN